MSTKYKHESSLDASDVKYSKEDQVMLLWNNKKVSYYIDRNITNEIICSKYLEIVKQRNIYERQKKNTST